MPFKTALALIAMAAPDIFGGAVPAPPRQAYTAEQISLVRDLTEARLSPNGCLLAAAADITGAQEVWTTPACGRQDPGWPEQLSSLSEQATDVEFSPDGRSLLFASDSGGDERRDLFLVPAAGGPVERLTSTPLTETGPEFSPDGRSIAYTADPDRPFLLQLHVLDLATRQARRLTREAVNVHHPVWSRDGRTIAVTRSGDDQKGELLLVDAAGGTLRVIDPPVKDGILFAQEYSPDGRWLLCLGRNSQGFMQLALVPAAGGPARFIGSGDWDVEEALWHPKAGILFTRNEDGVSGLYRLPSPEGRPARLMPPAGRIHSIDLDRAGARLAYLWEDASRPADAWILDLRTGKKTQLTRSVLGGVRPETLSRARRIAYPSFDGTVIRALYLPPRAALLGSPPPVVVSVHGGPNWQTFDDFNPLRQLLADNGFAVLAPNYRGSTGYGKAFEDSNNMDWGGGDLKDLIEGVRTLAGRGWADPARAGITGGSYGGFMTLIALTKSPEAWAAGVAAYGMPDLVLDYDLTVDRFGDWYRTEMGTPRTHAALFRDRSPIHFLDKVRAPLLIFQGANDTNVPRRESDFVYAALLKRKVPVGLVVYPDEGHGFTRRKNRVDYYRRTLEFFKETLGQRHPGASPGRAPANRL